MSIYNLTTHSGEFFEVAVKFMAAQEDGTDKATKRVMTIESMSFGEAENKALEESVGGDLTVISISRATYSEIITSDDEQDDKFYLCKLRFVTIDERTGKEKSVKFPYLVQAGSTSRAQRNIDTGLMGDTVLDYEVLSISETPIEDCYFL